MPFALLFLGILVIVVAIKKTHRDLFALLKDDFTGPNNFFYWLLAIAVLVIVGYNKTIRPLSDAFITLLIVVLILANKGLFAKFRSELAAGTSGKNTVTARAGNIGGDAINSVFNEGVTLVGSRVSERAGKIGVKLAGSGGFVY